MFDVWSTEYQIGAKHISAEDRTTKSALWKTGRPIVGNTSMNQPIRQRSAFRRFRASIFHSTSPVYRHTANMFSTARSGRYRTVVHPKNLGAIEAFSSWAPARIDNPSPAPVTTTE
jgi:hypothetical protein